MKINLHKMIEIGPVRSQTDCQMGTAGSAALRPSREYREFLLLAGSVSTDRWARTVVYAALPSSRCRQGTVSYEPFPAIRGEIPE